MRATKLFTVLLLATFILSACQNPGTGSPTSAAPTSGRATPTKVSTLFSDAESGVSLNYPQGWRLESGDGAQNLAGFVSSDGSFQSHLYVFPMTADTLEKAANEVAQSALAGLLEINYLTDETITLEDGAEAWLMVVTAKASNGREFKINLLVAARGAREFVLMSFGSPQAYDYYEEKVAAMVASLRMETPSLYGIPRDQALVLSGGESTNPRYYDPATTPTIGEMGLVFSGLVSFDSKLKLAADLAESWEVSTNGKVYTFHLRTNAVFHDGRPVTAQDVIYSWERAADPATESDTVLTYLGDIVGVKEMHEGQAEHISGLKAVDEHTLQVTIDASKPYFLLKLTYPTAFVVDQANVESGAGWYREPNGTGPYKLVRWDSFKVQIYQANENFYLGPPEIPYVVIQLYTGVDIRLYESGEIDIASVYPYDVSRVSDPADPLHADLRSGVDLCTNYIVFDVTQPPFDDAKVRQAFSMAFDRQKYIDLVSNGVGVPAKGIFPPALPGYNLNLQGLAYDPTQARQLLAESKYGGPEGLPPIVYTDAGIGNTAGAGAAAMAQMWQQNLGVTITIENLESNKYYDLLHAGTHGQIFESNWCADYPDPENFADVLFHTGAQQNLGNYSNPDLDALLDQARVERSATKRIQLYQQAEQMIVNDAAAIFVMHSISYVLVRPYVRGYVLLPMRIPLERYLWLEP